MTAASAAPTQKGILGWIEKTGNKLPDPVFIFILLIIILMAGSVVAAMMGLSVTHPINKDESGAPVIIAAQSLFSPENLNKLWVDMPTTFTHFHPLGYVLVVLLGSGVAEKTGLFAAAMRAGVRGAPTFLLTPIIALVAMVGNLAADAAYVVLIPLAGLLYAAVGRHPIAGIATAFAGVSGGFSANLFPGQLDALLLGITEPAAELLLPGWDANFAGNWFFIAGMTVFFLPAIWFVTDVIIEPRLKKQVMPEEAQALAGTDADLSGNEKRGLLWAGLAILFVVGIWLVLTLGPGTPLIDEAADEGAQMSPFYKSLVGGFFLLFLLSGWAYGAAVGTVKSHRDIVQMMSESMGTMAYFLVLAFFIAHFVAMFSWSNLGLILAVNGADFLKSQDMPLPLLLAAIVAFSALTNILIGSASAKWALMAPILVPMLMLLGVSPEMTTAAYRVGDGVTNIITPLMVYFPLILTFCQRWNKDFGLGSLMALMIPYSVALMIFGVAIVVGWAYFEWPLGPGAEVRFTLPTQP